MANVTVVLERIECRDTTEAGHDEVYYIKPTVTRIKGSAVRDDGSFNGGPGPGQGGTADGLSGIENTAWDCNDSGPLADQHLNVNLFTVPMEEGERVSITLTFKESDGDDLRKAEFIAFTISLSALAIATIFVPVLAGAAVKIGAALATATGAFQAIGGIPNDDDDLGLVTFTLDADGSTVRLRQVDTYPGRVVELSKNGTPARFTVYLNDSGASYYLTIRLEGAVTTRPAGSVVESPLTAELTAAEFTNWATASGDVATGRLNDANVTLTGPLGTAFFLHDDYPNYDQPPFTPQLPATGMVEIVGAAGHTFQVDFAEPVEDPVLLLGSLGSVMTFPPGTVVNLVSRDSGLSVQGNVVSGEIAPAHGPLATTDSNGSVRLAGVFPRISFTLEPTVNPGAAGSGVRDGVFFQVGGTRPV
jgi:hypothetical protein